MGGADHPRDSARREPDGTIQPDAGPVQHDVLADVHGQHGVLGRIAQARGKRHAGR